MVGQEGLEPPTTGLEIRCSIQLSYCPTGHALAQRAGKKYDAFRKLKIENKEISMIWRASEAAAPRRFNGETRRLVSGPLFYTFIRPDGIDHKA